MAADVPDGIVRQVGDEVRIRLPPGGPDALEMRFRPIPAKGRRFRMGQRDGEAYEQPPHEVELHDDYWLGTFVVTQGEWRAVARWAAAGAFSRPDGKPWDESPSCFEGNDRLPVENLEWFDAGAWCAGLSRWLADRGAGYQARLPGEAEWEFACRAGTETDYWSGDGDEALDEVGLYSRNSTSKTHPVDQSVAGNDGPEANAFGLVGMHGNVDEWCRDGYDFARYLHDLARTWSSHSEGDSDSVDEHRLRVIRGGSWFSSAWFCRSASRSGFGPVGRYGNLGFRVCLVRGPGSHSSGGEAAARGQRAEAEQAQQDEAGEARPKSSAAGEAEATSQRALIGRAENDRISQFLAAAAERSSAAAEKSGFHDDSVRFVAAGAFDAPGRARQTKLDFSGYSGLTHLFLWNLTDIEEITGLPESLVCLDLRRCTSLKSLPAANLPHLETLDLGGCSSLAHVPRFTAPSLRWGHFDGCTAIDQNTGHQLDDLLVKSASLEELTLVDCTWVSGLRLPDQSAALPQGWFPVGDPRFPPYRLKKLVLRGCSALGRLPSLDGYPWLHHLDLRGCAQLAAMPSLPFGEEAGKPTGIRTLYATGCDAMKEFCNLDIRRVHRGEGSPIAGAPARSAGRPRNVAGQFRALSALAADATCLRMAKVLVLGSGRCGKTTVSKALAWKALSAAERENPENAHLRPRRDESSTANIRLDEFVVASTAGHATLPTTVHLWDFGGQEIYHNTHRLFASEGTVFVIVTTHFDTHTGRVKQEIDDGKWQPGWKSSQDFADENVYRELEYWLDYVWDARGLRSVDDYQTAERRPKVIVVFTGPATTKEGNTVKVTDYVKQQAGRYRHLIGTGENKIPVFHLEDACSTDFDGAYGELVDIHDAVTAHAASVADELGIRVPQLYADMTRECNQIVKNNVAARKKMPKGADETLAFDEWERRVAKLTPARTPPQVPGIARAMADYFHECGRVFFRPRPRQPHTVIIDQQWAIDLVYRVVVNSPADHRGRMAIHGKTRSPFAMAELQSLIDSHPDIEQHWEFLVSLLDACDIVADLGNGQALATHPELLGPLDRDTETTLAKAWDDAVREAASRGRPMVNHSFAIHATGKGLVLGRNGFQRVCTTIARRLDKIPDYLAGGNTPRVAPSVIRNVAHFDREYRAEVIFWNDGFQVLWHPDLARWWDDENTTTRQPADRGLRLQWAHDKRPPVVTRDGDTRSFAGGIFVQLLCADEAMEAPRLREILFGASEPGSGPDADSQLDFAPPLADYSYSFDRESGADLIVHDFRPKAVAPDVACALREHNLGWLHPDGPTSDLRYDIAISYRRKASETFVAEMHAALSDAGFRVYYDCDQPIDESQPGVVRRPENTLARIYRFLRQARVLIVVPSIDYFATPTSKVTRADNLFCPVELADAILEGTSPSGGRKPTRHFWVYEPVEDKQVVFNNLDVRVKTVLRETVRNVIEPAINDSAGRADIHAYESEQIILAQHALNRDVGRTWIAAVAHSTDQQIIVPAAPAGAAGKYDFRDLIARMNRVLRSSLGPGE